MSDPAYQFLPVTTYPPCAVFDELWAGRESYLPRYAGTEHRVLSKRLLLTGFRG